MSSYQNYQQQQPPSYGYPPQQGYGYGQPAQPAGQYAQYGQYAQPGQQYSQPYNDQYAANKPNNTTPSYATEVPYNNNSDAGGAAEPGDKFAYVRQGPKWNDVWAAVLYFLHLGGFIYICYVGISHIVSTSSSSSPSTPGKIPTSNTVVDRFIDENMSTLIAMGTVSCVVGWLLSVGYMVMMYRMGGSLIKVTWWASVILTGILGIFMIANGILFFGFINLLVAVLAGLSWYWIRNRIALSALILSTTMDVMRMYPFTAFVALFSLILQLAYTILWQAGMFGAYNYYSTRIDPTSSYFILVFMILSFYWTSQVLKNTLHVTVSGVMATFFFLKGTSAMPKNPTLGAARRAFTYSFGSICFGSLIVAIIQTIRALARSASRDDSIIACIVDCILACIEGLVEYFNEYAFIQVAIYGKPYIQAAKDTLNLIRRSGVDAIINDSLIGSVLGMGTLGIGLLTASVPYIWGYAQFRSTPEYDTIMVVFVAIAAAAFFIGSLMMVVVTNVIYSSSQTTVVCLGEDPGALLRSKPELYHKFREVYPSIAVWTYV